VADSTPTLPLPLKAVQATLDRSPWQAKLLLLLAKQAQSKPWTATAVEITRLLTFKSGPRPCAPDYTGLTVTLDEWDRKGIIWRMKTNKGWHIGVIGITPECHMPPGETKPKAPRPPDLIWDAVCAVFALAPVTPTEKSRVGKIVRDLKLKGAVPADIPARLAQYRREWPKAADTPEALLKHWDRFGGGNGSPRGSTAEYMAAAKAREARAVEQRAAEQQKLKAEAAERAAHFKTLPKAEQERLIRAAQAGPLAPKRLDILAAMAAEAAWKSRNTSTGS
jgi:hypothetical protein